MYARLRAGSKVTGLDAPEGSRAPARATAAGGKPPAGAAQLTPRVVVRAARAK